MSKVPKTINYYLMMFSVQLEDTASIDRSFECSNPKYTEYYRIHAFNDMQTGIGKTWVLTYKDKAIGFISIAMAHIRQERHEDLQDNGFGNIPALLIGHLATHQDYENRGVGTRLLAWAIKKATEYSKTIGCSIVMLSPENKKNRG